MESRSLFYLIARLLDELLTVLDNDTLVVLIYLNAEEVTHSILHQKNALFAIICIFFMHIVAYIVKKHYLCRKFISIIIYI